VHAAVDNALAGLAATAVGYRIAVGPLLGQRTMRLRGTTLAESLSSTLGALTANPDGFSLNAVAA